MSTTVIWYAILAIAVLVAVVAAIRLGYKEQVKKAVFDFVVIAEGNFKGSGRGAEKKKWVLEQLRAIVPFPFSLLISEELLDKLVELAVTQMKAALAGGESNG